MAFSRPEIEGQLLDRGGAEEKVRVFQVIPLTEGYLYWLPLCQVRGAVVGLVSAVLLPLVDGGVAI